MKLRKTDLQALAIAIIAIAAGFYVYGRLPGRVASHWSAQGTANGYAPRIVGAFLMPAIGLLLWLFFIAIPCIDPKRANIELFRKYFDRFIILLLLFLLYLYGLTIAWNLGLRFNMVRFLAPAFAVIFYNAGILISHAKQNWTIGIRTPWTLESEIVWDRTHALGAKLFKAAAIVSLAGVIIPRAAVWLAIVPLALAVFISVVYSFVAFRKIKTTSPAKF